VTTEAWLAAESELEQVKAEVARLTVENETYLAMLVDYEAALRAERARVQAVTAELEQARADLAAEQGEHDDLKTDYEVLDERVQAVRAPLVELVRLKDGPRDDAYRAAKDAAWDAARAAIGDGGNRG